MKQVKMDIKIAKSAELNELLTIQMESLTVQQFTVEYFTVMLTWYECYFFGGKTNKSLPIFPRPVGLRKSVTIFIHGTFQLKTSRFSIHDL